MSRALPLMMLCLLLAACGEGKHTQLLKEIDSSLQRGVAYLKQEQDADGQWRSKTYGVFADGPSLTPHVMLPMIVLAREAPQTAKGAGAIAAWVDEQGRITPKLVNPVYGSAEASWVMLLTYRPEQMAFVERVKSLQLTEVNGWAAGDVQYGGWSDAPRVPTKPGDDAAAAHVDAQVSATLFAVGALKLGGVGPGDPSLRAAVGFVQRCRNEDGGFFFTPIDTARNKAGPTPEVGADVPGRRFHSYGTATADAVRILLACGVEPNDADVATARSWLIRHFDPSHPLQHPGAFNPDRETLRFSYDFYWAWSVAHAFDRLQHEPDRWAPQLARALIARQRSDGSWANAYTDGKEDDPLVATPFALAALEICREKLGESVISH